MKSHPRLRKRQAEWSPPSCGFLKFNVDGASRGKPGPVGIGGVLRDHVGSTSIIFTEYVGSMDLMR